MSCRNRLEVLVEPRHFVIEATGSARPVGRIDDQELVRDLGRDGLDAGRALTVVRDFQGDMQGNVGRRAAGDATPQRGRGGRGIAAGNHQN